MQLGLTEIMLVRSIRKIRNRYERAFHFPSMFPVFLTVLNVFKGFLTSI